MDLAPPASARPDAQECATKHGADLPSRGGAISLVAEVRAPPENARDTVPPCASDDVRRIAGRGLARRAPTLLFPFGGRSSSSPRLLVFPLDFLERAPPTDGPPLASPRPRCVLWRIHRPSTRAGAGRGGRARPARGEGRQRAGDSAFPPTHHDRAAARERRPFLSPPQKLTPLSPTKRTDPKPNQPKQRANSSRTTRPCAGSASTRARPAPRARACPAPPAPTTRRRRRRPGPRRQAGPRRRRR